MLKKLCKTIAITLFYFLIKMKVHEIFRGDETNTKLKTILMISF